MDYTIAMAAADNPRLTALVSVVGLPNKYQQLTWTDGAKRARIIILDALIRLEKPYQGVILARYGEDLTLTAYAKRIGRSRERVRQLEARALRLMRRYCVAEMHLLQKTVAIIPIPGGPLDPDWVDTKVAAELTALTRDHIRHLCREGKIESRHFEHNKTQLRINRASLKDYVQGTARRGRRRGIWKGECP